MIKTIIFDAGDVLFKTDFIKLEKKIKERYGITIFARSSGNKKASKEYLKEAEGKGSIEKVFSLLGANKEDIPKIIEEYKKLYIKYKTINKKLFKFIKKLKKDYKIICLTDTHKLHYDTNQKINFFKDFDQVFASHIQNVRKDHRNAFRKVLKQINAKPKETLFIDDEIINIKTAKSLRINVILYKEFPKIEKLKKEIYKYLNKK